jgi:HEAT repeat protein
MRFFKPNVKKMKAKGDIEGLIKTLYYNGDYEVCEQASNALAEIGAPAVGSLIRVLDDNNTSVRILSSWALVQIYERGDAPLQDLVVPSLIARLSDPNDTVRQNATWALVQIGDERAVEPLIACLDDRSDAVRVNATRSLGKVGSERAIELLVAILNNDPIADVRMAAIRSLGEIGDERVVEPLVVSLDDDYYKVRELATYTLADLGKKLKGSPIFASAVEPLIASLKDQYSQDVRRNAAWALAQIGDPRAIPALIDAREGQNQQVQEAIEEALGLLTARVEPSPSEVIPQPEVAAKAAWSAGANDWEELATAFIRLEIEKSHPNYKGLAQALEKFSVAERHGAWIRVAQEVENKTDAIRCYLEALYNNPHPHSTAWDWLSGEYDKDMNILPSDGPKTRETVARLRHQYGPISE